MSLEVQRKDAFPPTSGVPAAARSRLWRRLPIGALAVVVSVASLAAARSRTFAQAPSDGSTATAYPLPPDVRSAEVPAEFFGMHLVSVWSPGTVWPPVPVGMYRLLNATPRWHALHTARGKWDDDKVAGSGMTRITAALLFRERHGPGARPIYTLAGGDADAPSGFPRWLGPERADTLAEWRRYVREVGTRFREIRHWEIWNEADCPCSYGGTTAQLVALTKAAAEELRALDPRNRILAPAFTDTGLDDMEAFLAAGGGAHVDVITWHQDNAAVPERDTTNIKHVRGMMAAHGVGHLPLWTTEGHSRLQRGGDPVAVVARAHLVLWLFGVKSFHWYAWDIADYGPAFPGPWVTLTERGHADRPTAAGRAYGEIARWMVGSRIDSLSIDGDVWAVSLHARDGRPAWIVWRAGGRGGDFAVPAGVSTMRSLDGANRPWQGRTYAPTARPVLFR